MRTPGTGALLSVTLTSIAAFGRYYLDFVQGGGLFVPGNHQLVMHSPVCLILYLVDADQTMAVHGRVVWITPANAQRSRPQGIGVQFLNPDSQLEGLIDSLRQAAPENDPDKKICF